MLLLPQPDFPHNPARHLPLFLQKLLPNAKLEIRRATKPTPIPIPSEENKINAHTNAGMFLKNVANPLTTFANFGNGDTFSLPNKATKKARIAAIVVEDIASAKVTTTLEKIPANLPS